jgi:hypothetical protein
MTLELKLTDRDGQVTLTHIAPAVCVVASLPRGLRIPAKIELLEGGLPAQVRTLPHGRDILAVSAQSGLALLRMEDVESGGPVDEAPHPAPAGSLLCNAGMVVHGEAGVGSTVTVMWGGVIHIVPVDSGGRWQVPFPAWDIPPRDAVLYAGAHSPDPAATAACRLALVAERIAPPAPWLELIERDDGPRQGGRDAPVRLSGFAEPDTQVLVAWRGFRTRERAGADGAWTLRIPAAAIPPEGISTVCASACDAAGNMGPATVRLVSVGQTDRGNAFAAWVGADSVVRQDQPDSGVDIRGTAQAGAEVLVAWGRVAHRAAAGADGAWSVRFAAVDIQECGEELLSITVDGAGGLPVVVEAIDPSP